MPLPAFSNISLSGANARLKWATYFGAGQALGAGVEQSPPNRKFVKTFTGTDAVTGFNATDITDFFGANAAISLTFLTERVGTDSEFVTVIQSTDCPAVPPGSQELYLTASNVARDPAVLSYPQGYLLLTRSRVAPATLAPELTKVYHSAYFKTPSNLKSMLKYPTSTSNYYSIIDWKTGGYGLDAGIGDFRILVSIMENPANTLYWRVAADNNANGAGYGSIAAVSTYWATPSTPQDDSIAENEWYKIEIEVTRPELIWTRTGAGGSTDAYEQDITTGRTKAVVTRVSTGVRQTICDQTGGRHSGNENLPWARFFNGILYTGGGAGDGAGVCQTAAWTGLEFWDKAPYVFP